MSNDNSNVNASDDECPIYFGTPTIKEVKEYLRRLQKMPLEQQEQAPDTSDESSFEIDDSFQTMIERKRKQMMESRLREEDDVSASSQLSGGGDAGSAKFRGNDSTFIEHDSMRKTTDESFEEMERLCSMNLSKLGLSAQRCDEEEEAIRRILESSSKNKPEAMDSKEIAKASNDVTMGLGDCTQLDDVEEPSCLWENTMAPGAPISKSISPVKRMHMLRPSTIIEEATINETTTASANSKDTSLESYITAKHNMNGSDDCSIMTGSDIYRTADDRTHDHSKASTVNSTADSAVGFDATTVEKTSIEARDESIDVEEQIDEDVIVLSSSDSEAEDEPNSGDSLLADSAKMDTGSLFNNSDSLQEDPLCQEDSMDRVEVGSPLLDAIPDHFNDTMEEMEFMMRQGMKILQQQKAQQLSGSEQPKQSTGSVKKTMVASHTTPVTPISPNRYLKVSQHTSSSAKQTLFSYSASKSNSAHKPTSAPSTGASSCGAFKKPVSRFPLPKSAKKFDHIVSPIGEYIKKTPKSTLQARIFCANHNLIDVLHNKNDNRDSVMSSKENLMQQEVDSASYSSSLPRKGVVSSRGAHVIDERNPVRIPGGDKIHKLLNNSPTMVVRHEGRLRYQQRETQLTEDSVVDDSLADLSLASGDISVRVLKDVRRF